MKSILSILALSLCLAVSAQNSNKEESIKSVVKEFIEATDVQDAERLGKTMHEQSMQYVKFGPRVLTFTKAQYMEQLNAKKVGGQERSINFGELLDSTPGVTTIALTATSSTLLFSYQVTLLSVEGSWIITAINTEVARL